MSLRYAADVRTLLFLAGLTGAVALSLAGVLPQHPLLSVAFGVGVFVANLLKHNHVHCPTFRARGANVGMSLLLSVLTGTSCTGIIMPHQGRHHRAPQSVDDFVRASLVRHRLNAVNLLVFPFVSMLQMVVRKPSELVAWRHRRCMWRLALLERSTVIATAVVALMLAPHAALGTLILPWLFGQWALLQMNLLQHQHLDPNAPRHASRDVVGRVSNALFFNAGYHSAHHAAPGLHWCMLPRYHAEKIAGPDRQGLEFPSLFSLIVERLRARGVA